MLLLCTVIYLLDTKHLNTFSVLVYIISLYALLILRDLSTILFQIRQNLTVKFRSSFGKLHKKLFHKGMRNAIELFYKQI